MIFVVAGIPNLLFERFGQLVTKIFGDGHLIVSRPTDPRRDGKFVPSRDDAAKLISLLARRVEEDVTIVRDGCAVIGLASPGTSTDAFALEFRPFAVFKRIDLPVPTLMVGDRGRQTMNAIASLIRASLKSIREAVRVMNSELMSRRNRTPLLLPCRNFASNVLPRELDYLFASLASAQDVRTMIAGACQRIETDHPFRRKGGASFFDNQSIRFKMPGRDLHGAPHRTTGNHLPTCLLNGHFRLGGASISGFHYDCFRGEDGRLAGVLPNCHAALDRYAGNPHLNIYPNDYIR